MPSSRSSDGKKCLLSIWPNNHITTKRKHPPPAARYKPTRSMKLHIAFLCWSILWRGWRTNGDTFGGSCCDERRAGNKFRLYLMCCCVDSQVCSIFAIDDVESSVLLCQWLTYVPKWPGMEMEKMRRGKRSREGWLWGYFWVIITVVVVDVDIRSFQQQEVR